MISVKERWHGDEALHPRLHRGARRFVGFLAKFQIFSDKVISLIEKKDRRAFDILAIRNNPIKANDKKLKDGRWHLDSFREQLIANLSKICSLEHDKINVKATTTERLGFTGREEGIASICSILLYETS